MPRPLGDGGDAGGSEDKDSAFTVPPHAVARGAMGTWSSAPHLHWDFPPHPLPKTPLSLRLHRSGGWLPAGGGRRRQAHPVS